ncbi:MAG: hypothetical protein H0U44_10065 [Flavisolibacter sp.]|jgi:hypothetical protein|nr:hypothetical protein [Flavisolibacter sp.]
MVDLFKTNLVIQKQSIPYRIRFENEAYRFSPEEGAADEKSFILKREHDSWVEATQLPPDLKNQAVEALEKYLLQQH